MFSDALFPLCSGELRQMFSTDVTGPGPLFSGQGSRRGDSKEARPDGVVSIAGPVRASTAQMVASLDF